MENSKPKSREDLLQLLSRKNATNYFKVKGSGDAVTKDVDMSKRVVTGISNTFLFYDSDGDVLLPGCTKKSINDRGPLSKSGPKIKNVKDHVLSDRIGVPQVLDERMIDGKQCQYFESRLMENTKGNDTLIEYQNGAIDQHSIGFRYVNLELVTADDQDWSKYINMLINPKDAEDNGYMFVVSEIEQFEWSPVSFGANELTPYLGLKSASKEAMIIKAFERIDFLETQFKRGKQSDNTLFDYHLEALQLKQIISELIHQEPSIKDTLVKSRQNTADTSRKDLISCPDCGEEYDPQDSEDGNCPNCGCDPNAKRFDLSDAIQKVKIII